MGSREGRRSTSPLTSIQLRLFLDLRGRSGSFAPHRGACGGEGAVIKYPWQWERGLSGGMSLRPHPRIGTPWPDMMQQALAVRLLPPWDRRE